MNIVIREASLDDDLLELSKIQYLSDPYVYPPWFLYDEDIAFKCLEYLSRNSEIFNYKNTLIALDDNNKIVGTLLYLINNTNYHFNVFNKMWKDLKIKPSTAHQLTVEGYLQQIIDFHSDFYLLNLAVAKNARNQGIGTKLMLAFEEKISQGTITLEVVGENSSAISLYEKLGYEKIEEYKTFCLFNQDLKSYHMYKKI